MTYLKFMGVVLLAAIAVASLNGAPSVGASRAVPAARAVVSPANASFSSLDEKQAKQPETCPALFEMRAGNDADTKILSGSANGMGGGCVAKFEMPVSADEQKYLNDRICYDERECYGEDHFFKYITRTYPDIKRIRFPMDSDLNSLSREDLAPFKADFYRALYFAKRISLANGQTLFDFMTKCSRGLEAHFSASFDMDGKESIQFFPVLRRLDNGKEVDLNITFNRIGSHVEANSPWFSSHIITNPDFLREHGLRCWARGRGA
jgi:hypothetical protein